MPDVTDHTGAGGPPVGIRTPGPSRTVFAAEIEMLGQATLFGDGSAAGALLRADSGDTRTLDPHLILPLVVSLASANPLFEQMRTTQGMDMVAAMSHRVTVHGRIRAGDTITVDTELLAIRASASKPGQHIATFRDTAVDQDGAELATVDRVLLYRERPAAPAATGTDR